MALVVEDGTGLATAESYRSVTAADAYHAANGNTAWTGTEAAKEAALRKATRFLDGTYGTRLPGVRKTSTQRLELPRAGAYAREGYALPSDEIWPEVGDATCELALDALSTELTPNLKQGGLISSITVGPISKTMQTGAPGGTTRPKIALLLARVLTMPGKWQQVGTGVSYVYRT